MGSGELDAAANTFQSVGTLWAEQPPQGSRQSGVLSQALSDVQGMEKDLNLEAFFFLLSIELALEPSFPEHAFGCPLSLSGREVGKCIVLLLIRHFGIHSINYLNFAFCGQDAAVGGGGGGGSVWDSDGPGWAQSRQLAFFTSKIISHPLHGRKS